LALRSRQRPQNSKQTTTPKFER